MSAAITCGVAFQSTLSVRRATGGTGETVFRIPISIHALRKESDQCRNQQHGVLRISIHALRKESDRRLAVSAWMIPISIHALRKESDLRVLLPSVLAYISIHALRKESDRAAGHFCPLSETQASCLALSISNNTTGTTNNMPKTSSCLSVSF